MTTTVSVDRVSGSVYIGRPGRGEQGLFGNPYSVGRVCHRCRKFHSTAAQTLPCFRAYLDERAAEDQSFCAALLALRDQVLWCPGRCKRHGPTSACHGDVIVEWLQSRSGGEL